MAGAVTLVVTAAAAPGTAADSQFAPLATDESPAFELIESDLEFILDQIQIAEAHSHALRTGDTGYTLLCQSNSDTTGKCVRDPMLPHGLRTVDGSFNNLEFDTEIGKANRTMPRLLPIRWRSAGAAPEGSPPNPPGANAVCEDGDNTCYAQTSGFVYDTQPRLISNLVVDNTDANPTVNDAAANNPDAELDPTTGELYLPNMAPDEGLSAPVNMWFVFFGQFFDHGLDLVEKGGNGTLIVPLSTDDPLWAQTPEHLRWMALSRATNQPGPDGVVGTADDVREHENRTTPWVDQNQTYTSHPAHQVFLREYELVDGRPQDTGRLLNGADQDGDGVGDGLATWNDVKEQASSVLGIDLVDEDVLAVPQVAVDYYGNFIPGANGFPQLMTDGGSVEGNTGTPVSTADAVRTDQSFLDDIAEGATPAPPPDPEDPSIPGYDNVLLGEHFVTGDGRGNENIGLTAVHHVFHSEHNRLASHIEAILDRPGNEDLKAAFQGTGDHAEADNWSYAQRVFQAARFTNEMQYQHLVFEEFARTVQPAIDAVVFNENAYDSTIDASIRAEFAHVVYRFGHSMLTEDILRQGFDAESTSLLKGFLNPVAFHCRVEPDANNDCAPEDVLSSEDAAGAIVNGTTNQPANQIDELVTSTLRNNLLGLPLDLATINILRARDVGVPGLNQARRTFYSESNDPQLEPYSSWTDFGLSLKNGENFGRGDSTSSLVNFVAAYGSHPTILEADTLAEKRAAAKALVDGVSALDIVDRIAGANRFETAVGVSSSHFTGPVPVVYIASGANFPDALAAGPAAAVQDGPVLLVQQNAIPSSTVLELIRLQPQRIVVLGGPTTISEQVSNSLATYTPGTVQRLAGGNRYETAQLISQDAFATADTVYVADGTNFPDALAAGAAAGAENAPLLLVQPNALPSQTAAEIDRLNPDEIVIMGGTPTISATVEAALGTMAPTVTRLGGTNRYHTSVLASQRFASSGGTVYIATGHNFPDALAAAPVAAQQNAPILLTSGSGVSSTVLAEIERLAPNRVVLLGGLPTLSEQVELDIDALFPDPVAPGDRIDFMRSQGAWANEAGGISTTGLEDVDFWVGGLAEALEPFGGMLGSTFNYVFEQQLEDLQFGDRFYYLFRNQGNQLFAALEANSFSTLIQRNTNASLLPAEIFLSHDPYFDLENLPDPLPAGLQQMADGTWRWDGDEHVEIHGDRTLADRIRGGQGDDSLWGYGGNDRIEGGSGNDSIQGGPGDDILTDAFGDDNIKGGSGNDAIDGGPGIDLLLGQSGDDFVSKTSDNADGASGFLGTGNDIFVGGTGRDNPFGNEGDDWLEGGPHADLLMGDNGQQFQNDVDGGDDVLIGGAGSDDMDAEGGDDIMVGTSGGTDRFHGMFGYDWVTYDGTSTGVDADLSFNLLQPPDVTAIRDRYLQVEGLSGGSGDDVLRGLGVAPDDLDAEEVNKMTEASLDNLDGLEAILRPPAAEQDYALRFLADNPLLQDNDGVSNLILAGSGSDLVEGRFGDDFIDGDAVLQVRLVANGVEYTSAAQLKAAVFAGTVNPGDIDIVRRVVVEPGAEDDVDTAVYFDPFLNEAGEPNYTVTHLHDDYYEIVHIGGPEFEESEGQDILRNIEMLQFGDGACFELATMEACPVLGFVTFEGQTNPPTEDQPIIATVTFEDGVGNTTVADPRGIRFNWQAGEVGEAWDPSPTGDSLPDQPNGRVDTFTPGDGDAGAILRVVVTFTDDNGVLRQIPSGVVGGPENLTVVNINDDPYGLTINNPDPVVGSALVPSPFQDPDGLEESVEAGMTYVWQTSADGFEDDVEDVATRVTPDTFLLGYTVQPADLGRQVRVQVTFTDDQGTVETLISPPTNAVQPAP